jgi:Tfp pilus assembly protein PilO
MAERLAALTLGRALIIGLILGAVYYSAFFDDGSKLVVALKAAKVELDKNKKEIENVNIAIKDAERFQQTMALRSAEMQKILKAMPAELTSIDFMKIVSNEAKGIGAEINKLTAPLLQKSMTLGKAESVAFYEPVPIDVELTASYNQIMLFMANLTKLDKIVTAQKVKLVATGDPRSKTIPNVHLTATLLAYKYIRENNVDSKTTQDAKAGAGTKQ